ncbi:MAG TPA: hypothetical protein VGQ59_09625 [Cyclobacteriaceae bacterium]|jgi:hypothetical protein|nr:hypothetical protein [Cyclobacteriaceae bacterium]
MMSLKNILLLNGASSGATGVLLLAFSRFFANLFQISSTIAFTVVGIFLIVFTAVVIWVSIGDINRRTVRLIITLDTIWVGLSFIVAIIFYDEISLIGSVLIEIVAIWVAAMAILQTKGLKQSTL